MAGCARAVQSGHVAAGRQTLGRARQTNQGCKGAHPATQRSAPLLAAGCCSPAVFAQKTPLLSLLMESKSDGKSASSTAGSAAGDGTALAASALALASTDSLSFSLASAGVGGATRLPRDPFSGLTANFLQCSTCGYQVRSSHSASGPCRSQPTLLLPCVCRHRFATPHSTAYPCHCLPDSRTIR